MSARGKASLFLIVAFLLGVAVGGLGLGVYVAQAGGRLPFHEPQRFQANVLRRLSRDLDLQPDQRERVQAILRDTGQEFAKLREEMRPRYQEIRTRSRDRIRGVLDQQQQVKFDQLAAEWQRRAQERRNHP
jgi:hypothetical protein